jgi:dUTP pyrophosphatase
MEEELLRKYGQVMELRLYTDNMDLKLAYLDLIEKRNAKMKQSLDFLDAGFDLLAPKNMIIESESKSIKFDHEIKCSAFFKTNNYEYFTGYYLYPRSSISKTKLRLANSVGIIDAGYRGNLIAAFDSLGGESVNKFDRLVQICGPNLCPIVVKIVEDIKDLSQITERGEGGFGSTGK